MITVLFLLFSPVFFSPFPLPSLLYLHPFPDNKYLFSIYSQYSAVGIQSFQALPLDLAARPKLCIKSWLSLYHYRGQEQTLRNIIHIFKNFFQVYFIYFERERESTSRGGAERAGERIPSRVFSVSVEPNAGLDPIELWDHDLSWNQELDILTDWATRVPPRSVTHILKSRSGSSGVHDNLWGAKQCYLHTTYQCKRVCQSLTAS